MIGLIQRVSSARVTVKNEVIGEIEQGILLLLGVEKKDDISVAKRLAERVCRYRIFEDVSGKMNLSLQDIAGELLIVPQFTLPADTQRGNRPSFTPAAPPEMGKQLFDTFCELSRQQIHKVETGQFGADMQVQINNDGPVTFWLQQ